MMTELTYKVKIFDFNSNTIKDYDIGNNYYTFIKTSKKKASSISEFSEILRRKFMHIFWSRCEYELLLKLQNNEIILYPWVGSKNPEEASLNVTTSSDFDWHAFIQYLQEQQNGNNEVFKFNIYDQLMFKWNELIDYFWYTRLKYERYNPKFNK